MRIYLYIILFFLSTVFYAQQGVQDTASVKIIPLGVSDNILSSLPDSSKNLYAVNARHFKKLEFYPLRNIRVLQEKKESFLKSDWIYFIGTAALAAVVYFLLPEDKADVQKNYTFGIPPGPK